MKNLDLIKKLLRLSRDQAASPAEAAQALSRALNLAQEQGINLDDIDPNDASGNQGLTHDEIIARHYGVIEREAVYLVQSFFRVKALIVRERRLGINFVGLPDAVQLARYSFEYLTQAARRAWRKNNDRRIKRDGFIIGFFVAIRAQMPEAFRTLPGNALALSADHYMRTVICPGSEIKTNTAPESKITNGSYFRGIMAGRQAGIRNALKDSSRTLA